MVGILIGGNIAYLIGILVLSFTKTRITSDITFRGYALLNFFMMLAIFNLEIGFIPQKAASEYAFELHNTGAYLSDIPNFVLQALLNYPAFVLSGSWTAAIGTNAALSALVFVVTYGQGGPAYKFVVAPAVVNFSMFALRDPIIGPLFYAFTALAIAPHSRRRTIGIGLLTIAFYYTRPENLVIIGVALALVQYRRGSNQLVRLFTLPGIAVAMYGALRFGPRLLGVQTAYSALEAPRVLEEFFERRSNRTAIDEGNASAILGGRLPSLAFPVRFPLQIFTFIVLPLPFEIRSLSMLLAFVDSLFLAWIVLKYRHRIHRDALLIAVVFVLLSAFFMSNYGNGFRLRLPLYFVLAAGVIAGDRSRAAENATRAGGPVREPIRR